MKVQPGLRQRWVEEIAKQWAIEWEQAVEIYPPSYYNVRTAARKAIREEQDIQKAWLSMEEASAKIQQLTRDTSQLAYTQFAKEEAIRASAASHMAMQWLNMGKESLQKLKDQH